MVQPHETEPSSLIALANPNPSSDFAATPSREVVRQQINVAKAVLHQAVDLVDNHLTSDEQLTVNSKYISGSTIGKHIRHAVDHVNILLNSMSSLPPRVISYDIRIRNTSMESNRQSAKNALLETIAKVEEIIPTMNFDEEIVLNAITPYTHTFKTTLGREVWFVSLHCLHHWTVVRLIAGELGVLLSEDFGFAPSTLLHT